MGIGGSGKPHPTATSCERSAVKETERTGVWQSSPGWYPANLLEQHMEKLASRLNVSPENATPTPGQLIEPKGTEQAKTLQCSGCGRILIDATKTNVRGVMPEALCVRCHPNPFPGEPMDHEEWLARRRGTA